MTQSALDPITKLKSKPAEIEDSQPWTQGLLCSRVAIALAILLALMILLFLLLLALGSVNIPIEQIIRVLLGGQAEKESWTNIILKFRLPKALTATLAGAALGVCGLAMQTFFRNPLADPYTLGISSGASLGVALAVLSTGAMGEAVVAGLGFTSDLGLVGAASLGASATLFLMLLLARRTSGTATLLIMGLMFGALASSVVSLLMYFSVPERIQQFITWGFGTFGGVTWSQLVLFAPLLILGLVGSFALGKTLNALLLGENYARSLGVNLQRSRLLIIALVGLMAGTVTAFCGPIGFLGVAVPHLCRGLLRTTDHHILIPASLLMGAAAALAAALIAEVPGSNLVLPVNAVTALLGAPVVIAIVLRRSKHVQIY
jgi:iron complex transport system permease protein